MRHGPRTFALLALLTCVTGGVRLAAADDPVPAAPSNDETRGYVGYGVNFVRALTADQRKEMKIARAEGLFVNSVLLEGPAEKAGLQVGDVILTMNGKEMPETKGVDLDKPEAAEAFLKGPFSALTSSIKPGDAVELVVDRNGTTVTVKAVAMDKPTMDKLVENAQEEARSTPVPKPEGRGEPTEEMFNFEKIAEDAVRPDDMLSVAGAWEGVKEEGATPENTVLRQDSDVSGFAVCLVTGDNHVYSNGTISVRFQLLGGETSVSGGLVVRARDRKNWYGIRVDGVSQDVRIIAMKAGTPTVLAKKAIGSPKLKAWHTLEVTFQGEEITATYNGTTTVTAKDASFASGWCGLLTSEDAETYFDDLKLVPAK